MPSIPQSLLWISLVVLWLFVLVPMLISKRDAVRRTSDVALATRVLNRGVTARLLKRGGPAAGHRSDPDWQPEDSDCEDLDSDESPETGSVTVAAAANEQAEFDYLDVDVVDEDASALPAGVTDDATEPEFDDETFDGDLGAEYSTDEVYDEEASGVEADSEADADTDPGVDEYEYIEDTSGLDAEEDPPTAKEPIAIPAASRRRRYDTKIAAAVIARKYQFRKRVLMAMALVLVVSAAVAYTAAPTAWWVCGSAAGVTMLYLAYLRRQTRIEQRVRARRMQRIARLRLGVENAYDHEFDVVPSRLRRPGAAVLEIDDEDPIFEHLEYVPYARDYDWRRDLPRAAGQ